MKDTLRCNKNRNENYEEKEKLNLSYHVR